MNSKERRDKIIEYLSENKDAINSSALVSMFKVSRQVIVGDIALLRAKGVEILSTPRGYILNQTNNKNQYVFKTVCFHNVEETVNELYTIVDNGGTVMDVIVEHPIYGQLIGQLNIASRFDTDDFIDKVKNEKAILLSKLTEGIHTHTISCNNEAVAERIKNALNNSGFLFNN